MNDSTTQSFLTPLASPADDDGLVDLLQPIIAAVGGWKTPSLVRPRWQPDGVPNQPDFETDWCALGIGELRDDTFNFEAPDPADDSADTFEYSESFDVLLSCYGPNAGKYARNVKDGIRVAQNRAPLQALNIDVLETSALTVVPALTSGRWLRRVDVTITMRRYVTQRFAVRSLLAGGLGIDNEFYVTPILVQKPVS